MKLVVTQVSSLESIRVLKKNYILILEFRLVHQNFS